jgi:multidrug efflux system outer membrane protein
VKTKPWRTASTTLPLAALATLLLAGCATGPDYKRPDPAVPSNFRAQIGPSDANSLADLPWWSVFQDKALQDLIGRALVENQDLKIAVSRIEQARQQVLQVKSQNAPQLNYQVLAGGQKIFAPQPNGGDPTITYGTFAGIFSAAWELDLWHRIKHETEAAEANALAQEDIRRGVILTLVSDLAADYFHLIELDRELAIAEESNRVYKRTLDLFNDRFQAGRDSELPVARTQAAYNESGARIAALKQQIGVLEDAISTLAGDYPHDIPRGKILTEQTMPATPVGQTTELLRRRPDILQAEQTMIGANAQIGVAVANFYPRVGLSALFGGQGAGYAGTFNAFTVAGLLGQMAGPIFDGGRLKAAYHEKQAFWDETVAEYKKTVLGAFQETSDALIAQQNLVGQRKEQEVQVQALQRSVDLALTRYDAGRSSYLEVLEAEQQLFPAQDALAQTQRDQLLAVVSLYKALGGGWQLTPEQWSQRS